MGLSDLGNIFQGIGTLFMQDPSVAIGRIVLIFLGFALVYLGKKEVLEPLLMIPMGMGMSAVNAGVLVLDGKRLGTLFVDPLVTESDDVLNALQIDWLQPIYTFMFSNGLIACLVFMGIGVLLDVGYVMARPFQSMFIALCAEAGTFAVFPLALALGMSPGEAASVATIGGADGPMVLFTSLILAPELFVPITVVGYLYLGLAYGAFPYLVRWLIPAKLRGLPMPPGKQRRITSGQKLAFAVGISTLLSLLFPVAAPLFLSLFVGVAVRESGIVQFQDLMSKVFLYGATFFLGLTLGALCEAGTLLNPAVLKLLLLGMLALLISALGGILGGYILYFATGGKVNPVVGIAGVSCVPTTAKVAQKVAGAENPAAIIMPAALGASISGVITSAIIAGTFVALLR
ncbi:sodium ion-translocating decarboxylase subunit beta [Gephyromycinifex aptenodytis]|uniref:sodium ion-translocating decarboxylase subunit beta n=1 Tax=Gephyromycinifex aptenodytis TaxID=2716227 RepID=UPI00144564C4|nr:sodium ion-translocating decarboxylase subunit beta [Gephyromycinifex aptenodytis]